jgi:hypothetical protein
LELFVRLSNALSLLVESKEVHRYIIFMHWTSLGMCRVAGSPSAAGYKT